MPGTRIENLRLTKVVDGDTVKVQIDGREESLRLVCLDTEESRHGGSKPITNAGKLASKWAKQHFGVDEDGFPGNDVLVHIEFDTNDPVPLCMKKHRDKYDRILCYVYKDDENYNLRAVAEGWSPYFVKYGRSRIHHGQFISVEADAQSKELAIWNPETNAGGNTRDYATLIPWWHFRDSVIQDYRHFGIQGGVLSVRLDYEDIVVAAKTGSDLMVLCDLQGGIAKWPGGGALIYAGSPTHKFNLWIPDRNSTTSQRVLSLIEKRYTGHGRGYVYVSGKASLYPPNASGKPEIVLTDVAQLGDLPPG